jgi:magnesium-transporting ATPase (P-type)
MARAAINLFAVANNCCRKPLFHLFASASKTQILFVKGEGANDPESRDELTCGPVEAIFQRLGSSPNGLTSSEACERLARFGANRLKGKGRARALALLLGQFKSPIILILIGAAVVSIFLQDASDAAIIVSESPFMDQEQDTN